MRTIDFWPRRPMDADKLLRGAAVAGLLLVLAAAGGAAFLDHARSEAGVAKTLLDLERKKRAKAKRPVAQERAELDAEMARWRAQEEDARSAPSRARGATQALAAFDVDGARVDRFLLKWDGAAASLRAEGAAQSRESALAAGHALGGFGAVASGGAVDVGWDGASWGFLVRELPPLPPKPVAAPKPASAAVDAKAPAKFNSDLAAPASALAPAASGAAQKPPRLFNNGDKP